MKKHVELISRTRLLLSHNLEQEEITTKQYNNKKERNIEKRIEKRYKEVFKRNKN